MDPLSSQLPSENSQKYSPRTIATFLGAIVLFSIIVFYSLSQFNTSSSRKDSQVKEDEEIVKLASTTLVYGTWSGKESVILAYDLSTGKEGIIAKLPSNVKKISVLSSDSLLFINQTDLRDYGQEIAVYSVSKGTTQTIFRAADEFGIDDYVLSPNKEYIATWEVQPDANSGALENGRSRVYTGRISDPGRKNIIQDEAASNTPISYPVAVLDDGTVFTDKFLPNSGAGWAYGLSVSNFIGTEKQSLPNMANGTYGTQPILSPDGKYLAFAGYDGVSGSGTSENRGFRQAILTPNTVELLDTTTYQRELIPKISTSDIYNNIKWDESGENLYYTIISRDKAVSGNYSFSLLSRSSDKRLDADEQVSTALGENLVLIGESSDNNDPLGNLGNTYASSLTQLAIKDVRSGQKTVLPLSTSMTQIIDTVPNNYFTNIATNDTQARENNIQLRTFEIKPTLEPKREIQQTRPRTNTENKPRCRDLATEQCNATLGTSYAKPQSGTVYRNHRDKDFAQCYNTQWEANRGKCSDSPLYIYGPKNTQLSVKIHTPIFDSSAPYADGYHTTLNGDGTFMIEDKKFASIDFDYTPALRKIVPPTEGTVVAVDRLESTLREYAAQLGLNKKETFDLVQFGKTSVSGPYVFVSLFDHETSHALLPMTFSKTPNTYRNMVFYFKNLNHKPNYSINPLSFEKINRGELTVIEISGMVE